MGSDDGVAKSGFGATYGCSHQVAAGSRRPCDRLPVVFLLCGLAQDECIQAFPVHEANGADLEAFDLRGVQEFVDGSSSQRRILGGSPYFEEPGLDHIAFGCCRSGGLFFDGEHVA